MRVFATDSDGALEVAGYEPPATNAEAYDLLESDLLSAKAIAAAAEGCAQLCCHLASVCYPKLVAQNSSAPGTSEEIDEAELSAWLGRLKRDELKLVQEELRSWFTLPPDLDARESFAVPADARDAAYKHFFAMDFDTLGELGVEVVEGECPGSSYYAAELHKPAHQANAVAARLGLDCRFVGEDDEDATFPAPSPFGIGHVQSVAPLRDRPAARQAGATRAGKRSGPGSGTGGKAATSRRARRASSRRG